MKKLIGLIACIMLLGLSSVFAQSKEVTGTITDMSGLGMPGVSVSIKGTTEGTNTDIDGKWGLTVSPKDVIIVSFVGMKTQEIAVGDKTVINVLLEEDRVAVEEVMVIGYGTAKKSSFTGSASVVKNDQLAKTPSVSLTKALQANAPGVQVASSSGAAGSDATIRIRGIGSLTAGSSPLWVVDGVVGAPKPHMEDVKSMTVLKDAASCSIYGSRAANGVILVQTKSGKVGRTQFDFQAKYSVSNKTNNKFKLLNSKEFYKVSYEGLKAYALANPTKTGGKTPEDYANYKLKSTAGVSPYNIDEPYNSDGSLKTGAKLMIDEDWNDLVNRTGITKQYDLSANGGDEKTKFYFSVGYFDQEGIIKPDFYSKYTAQVNVTNKVSDKLKVGFKASLKRSESNGVSSTSNGSSTGYAAYTFPNNVSLYKLDSDFNVERGPDGKPKYNWDNKVAQNYNPIGLANLNMYNQNGTYVYSSLNLNYQIVKNLVFDTKFSAKYGSSKSSFFETKDHGDASAEKGRSQKDMDEYLKYISSSTLTYNLNFDELHHLNALVGYEFEAYNYTLIDATAVDYGFNFSDELSVGAKAQETKSSTLDTRMVGMFSRLNYDFDNKYYASASYRRDASSKFAPDNRWGSFYSISASWRVTQEDFMQDYSWIDDLKVKASYGTNGNAGLPSYLFMPLYGLGGNYNDNTGIIHTQLMNKELQWEKNIMTNIGVDFGLFGFLTGSFEWFVRESDKLLMKKPLAYSTGWSTRTENVGAMKNTGFEFMLSSVNLRTDDFTWTTDFNISAYTNEITALSQEEIISPKNYSSRRWAVGNSVYSWYMKDYAGVNKENGKAQWWKNTKDADGKITGKEKTEDYSKADFYEPGTSLPDFYGGLNNSLTYKDFTLGVQLYFSVGGKIYDGLEATTMSDGSKYGQQLNAKVLDAWRSDNKNSDIPQFIYNNTTKSNYKSTRFLHDASFLRVKNVNLTYNVPKKWSNKLGLQSAKAFVNADNLFTFTDYEGLDPEQGVSGNNGFSTIPNVRTFTFGVRVGF